MPGGTADGLAIGECAGRRYAVRDVASAGAERTRVGLVDGTVERPEFVWRMVAILFAVGATVGALSLIVPHPNSFDTGGLWAIVGIAYLGTAMALLVARRAPVWPVHAFVAVAIALVAIADQLSDDPGGFYSIFYVWIALFVVYFFSRRAVAAYIVGIAVAYAAVLVIAESHGGPARWITTIGTVALSALVVDWLVRRVRSAAAERTDLLAALAEDARTDDLTGLPNRRAWDEALERELARAARERTPLCVALIDLDRFKRFNDDHGHLAGDRLLKEIAAVWGNELRSTDVLARYGGEEFALALPGCDTDDAATLLERLRSAMPEDQTCSVGVALWDAEESAERLFGLADNALYAAKESGRDRVVAA